jgi:hypothetical protein
VRLIAFILLAALLPAASIPAGAVVCFASDHVSMGCHESNSSACHDSAPESSDTEARRSCVDVRVSPVQFSSSRLNFAALSGAFLFDLLPELRDESTLIVVVHRSNPHDPPWFSGREFSSSIALRC